jgi:pyruvate ferredoxin oxidoreductase gamma subunit
MFQVRFHGRSGQGVVTAAELLASAAFREDHYAQAFPSFGSERMGAPVVSCVRIDNKPIRTHEPVTEPDALLIQDPTLLHQADLFAGLKPRGYVLVNAAKGLAGLGLANLTAWYDIHLVPASSLAMARLGRPLPGAPMIAALAALAGVVSLDAVLTAISDRFTGQVAAGNAAAAVAAFDYVLAECNQLTGA